MDRRQFMAGVASAAAGGVFGGTALAADLLKFIYCNNTRFACILYIFKYFLKSPFACISPAGLKI